MAILTLPDNLRKNGFDYIKVLEGKRSFVFRQCIDPKTAYFEVFKKRIIPEYVLGGKIIPEHIQFPSDESFGNWAWTFKDFDMALKKFDEIENN